MNPVSPLRKPLASFLFLLLLLPVAWQCSKKTGGTVIEQADSPYIFSHTSGIISRGAQIRVTFVDAAIPGKLIGSDAGALIQCEPSIAGKATWEDDRTISFKPDDLLPVDTRFRVELDMKAIKPDVQKGFEQFWFDVQTRPMYLDYRFDQLQNADPANASRQTYSAYIISSDIVPDAELQKAISLQQDGNPVTLTWEHDAGGTIHRLIAPVSRGTKPVALKLDIHGESLGAKEAKTETLEIPGTESFEIIHARVENDQEAYVQLNFSNPLSADQVLEGLIRVDDFTGTLRLLRDGNILRIYPSERFNGKRTFRFDAGIQDSRGRTLGKEAVWSLDFVDIKPQVQLLGKGVILPASSGLIFPFRAINLKAVDVEILKIYSNNIFQFLQENELDGNSSLNRVGKIVFQQKIVLQDLNASALMREWNRYALDLSKFIQTDPEAMYQVRIGFKPEYSDYACSGGAKPYKDRFPIGQKDEDGEIRSFYDGNWDGIAGYYEGYDWNHTSDPCYPEYYSQERYISRNVFASNLGLLAKAGTDGSYFVVATDLRTAKPWSGVELRLLDYHNQEIAKGTCDGNGFARIRIPSGKPFLIIAQSGQEKGYLKVGDGNSLSMSRFDIQGQAPQKGLKGFIYGERGVWRPGDSLYLHFVLEDKLAQAPTGLPVSYELKDPKGQLQSRGMAGKAVGSIYPIRLATSDDAMTGSWNLQVQAGGATFYKNLSIEAIKPNRLKINFELPKRLNVNSLDKPIALSANWLSGAPASNLRVQSEMSLRAIPTTFPGYPKFAFDDPARDFTPEPAVLIDEKLDADGKTQVRIPLHAGDAVAGRLQAVIKTRVFEQGGDASIDQTSTEIDPYSSFVGVSLPRDADEQNRLDLGKQGSVQVVVVDAGGNPLANQQVELGLYRSEWRWWWDNSYDYVSRFNSSDHKEAIMRTTVTTNSRGLANWDLNITQWGRYLVRACGSSGHCTGDFFYVGNPWDDGGEQAYEEASMLSLKADKESYQVGEQINIRIPSAAGSRILVSLENGVGVSEAFWQETKEGQTLLSFKAKAEWAPTIYVNISLIQPHGQSRNDLPIRMYGVIPLKIENPQAILKPQIQAPAEFKPETQAEVKVSEAGGKEMSYTLALVDEGLLDITRFKTPDPYGAFNAKEALGVWSWDLYDQVLGGYGAAIEKLFAIGGDGAAEKVQSSPKANRFPPMVKVLGPFQLGKGKSATHKIAIPNYIGSLRIMVVAAGQHSYGSAEKAVPVRKDLMVLATLPRILAPGDQIALPVSVFANSPKIKNATVTVSESSGLAKWSGSSSQQVSFAKPGEQVLRFPATMQQRIGVARFTIKASGNGVNASQSVEIAVRNPNPYETESTEVSLGPNSKKVIRLDAPGIAGSNTAYLEVSSIPPVDLSRRLGYLLEYPYGCLEQTVSAAFPQLYVSQFAKLDSFQSRLATYQIQAAIQRLRFFDLGEGSFSTWPGGIGVDHWATSYAGDFMLEAQKKGFSVPADLLAGWKNFQANAAKRWDRKYEEERYYRYDLVQAYRLYTLALAGAAETASMNRLREDKNLSPQARWTLAAAYALTGRREVAADLIKGLNTAVPVYREMSFTYGSELRDQAMILEALDLIGDQRALGMVKSISNSLNSEAWYGTQSIAYALKALGAYYTTHKPSGNLRFTYKANEGKAIAAGSNTPLMNIRIPVSAGAQSVEVVNQGNAPIFARLVIKGQPATGSSKPHSSELAVSTRFVNRGGTALDLKALKQGMDFIAEVTVINSNPQAVYDIALDQIFPAGWEIRNDRIGSDASIPLQPGIDYQDIRDDRVTTFFDLSGNSRKTFRVSLNAAYTGQYYMPGVIAEAMYDNRFSANSSGSLVNVIP